LSPCASLTLSFATITIVRDRINTNQSSFTHSLLTTSYFTNLTAFLFCFSSVVLQLLQVLRLPSLPSFCIYNSLYLPGSVLFCVSRLLSVYTTLCSFRRLYSSVSLALYLCLQLCVALCSFRCSRTSPAMRAATNSRAGFTRSFESKALRNRPLILHRARHTHLPAMRAKRKLRVVLAGPAQSLVSASVRLQPLG
jgi:hypothetical protein